MDKPRVKPLVWRVDDSRTAYAQTRYFVDRYCIEHRLHGDDQFDLWIGPDAVRATRFPTLETAKAAAQADYEARILAALEPVTVQRCAECDCDNPPDGCNWIAAESAPITVQEAARDNYNAVYRRLINRCVARLRRADTDKEAGDGKD